MVKLSVVAPDMGLKGGTTQRLICNKEQKTHIQGINTSASYAKIREDSLKPSSHTL